MPYDRVSYGVLDQNDSSNIDSTQKAQLTLAHAARRHQYGFYLGLIATFVFMVLCGTFAYSAYQSNNNYGFEIPITTMEEDNDNHLEPMTFHTAPAALTAYPHTAESPTKAHKMNFTMDSNAIGSKTPGLMNHTIPIAIAPANSVSPNSTITILTPDGTDTIGKNYIDIPCWHFFICRRKKLSSNEKQPELVTKKCYYFLNCVEIAGNQTTSTTTPAALKKKKKKKKPKKTQYNATVPSVAPVTSGGTTVPVTGPVDETVTNHTVEFLST